MVKTDASLMMYGARVEAVREVALGIIVATNDAVQRHGCDPENMSVLLAGFACAVDQINDSVATDFRQSLIRLLVCPT